MAEIRRIVNSSSPPQPVGRPERKNLGERNPEAFREILERQQDEDEDSRQEGADEEREESPSARDGEEDAGEAEAEDKVGRHLDRRV